MGPADRRRQIIAMALWLPEPFVTQPGVGSHRMERKILRPFRQLDFVNVDSFCTVSKQKFLSFGFLLLRMDAHPNYQALRFRKPFQPQRALSPQPPTCPKHRAAAANDPAQRRE